MRFKIFQVLEKVPRGCLGREVPGVGQEHSTADRGKLIKGVQQVMNTCTTR